MNLASVDFRIDLWSPQPVGVPSKNRVGVFGSSHTSIVSPSESVRVSPAVLSESSPSEKGSICRIDRTSPSCVGSASKSPSPSVMGRLSSVTLSMSISAISMMPPPVPSKRLSDVPTSRTTTLSRLFSSIQSPLSPCPPSISSSPQKSTRVRTSSASSILGSQTGSSN